MTNSFQVSTVPQNLIKKDKIFIFLGGHNFWEGLFDTVNLSFVETLVKYKIIDCSNILVTTIIPKKIPNGKAPLLKQKEDLLRNKLRDHGININFYHIPGRTLKGLRHAARTINDIASKFDETFIWAKNYFNCLIGILLKKKIHNTWVHFDMMGLVPQEELLYSNINFISRFVRFFVLRILEIINIRNTDSISVVSKKFQNYLVARYNISSKRIHVIPCTFNQDQFFFNESLRVQYRKKYQTNENEKIILYSGMLQKWQNPSLLFKFLKHIQLQDRHGEFKYMILTFDKNKAHQLSRKYSIKNVFIDSVNVETLNGLYNAADICIALRVKNIVSYVSSPVKIPEYLSTRNSLVSLTYIGDFGMDLQQKKYVLLKQDKNDLLSTSISEIRQLEKPNEFDLMEISEKYAFQKNMYHIRKVFNRKNEE